LGCEATQGVLWCGLDDAVSPAECESLLRFRGRTVKAGNP